MLDIKIIRKMPKECEDRLRKKDPKISLDFILSLDQEVRQLKTKSETLQAERRVLSQEIHKAKTQGVDATNLIQQVEAIVFNLQEVEQELDAKYGRLQELLSHLPNYPADDVPISEDKSGNQVIKTVGDLPTFSFPAKHHLELNQKLEILDFQAAAKTTGSGWPAYKNRGVLLEWALLTYMLQKQAAHGFQLWLPPLLVKKEILFGSGQIPKFDGQYYRVEDGDQYLYLIPTAEVVLNGFHTQEIFGEKDLPLYYAASTPCFRREAGAAGAHERGLVRVHQFHKVEMFAFTRPDQDDIAYAKMLNIVEEILKELKLPYRLSLLSTGDMSFTASKTIDAEVWLPGQNAFYEVSSISQCTDFQSRRSGTRYKDSQGKLQFVHTLNGSGLATPRLLVAILENNQQADGSVIVPEVLRPYLGGLEILSPQDHG
ncbi:Serine--tRNA ligase,seryl-tRNA synthetase,Prolyl-tRNA synthetase,serine--tRNA ligase,tRNA synthetase class II core domain (G, H, P, S and T) [Chlamydia serpentis]|uniref:Serine--tRNA ligase n=1 Tax=Chlamydia serpentis TaxID=1967782 RepID=A0A2R8FCC3_9CHLA|nr:serine--tRNA ligase [Chlamydia serpentis]SPN73982.1 Serine--tRNA ligase,seryl-tRNA synthetase,Prolyl-tRNA synthetase,serine--tRNA ligase,tRNA synthetase class II core domain (G, H, P, S and T) [Chlamydia serpentis]